jgi:hypothetical protein
MGFPGGLSKTRLHGVHAGDTFADAGWSGMQRGRKSYRVRVDDSTRH